MRAFDNDGIRGVIKESDLGVANREEGRLEPRVDVLDLAFNRIKTCDEPHQHPEERFKIVPIEMIRDVIVEQDVEGDEGTGACSVTRLLGFRLRVCDNDDAMGLVSTGLHCRLLRLQVLERHLDNFGDRLVAIREVGDDDFNWRLRLQLCQVPVTEHSNSLGIFGVDVTVIEHDVAGADVAVENLARLVNSMMGCVRYESIAYTVIQSCNTYLERHR